ncbi:MAG: hypothetical protein H0U51_10435 [Propionibacteriales bacterium]|nr:hypothetical protein [Propionibacteriales bacterium]
MLPDRTGPGIWGSSLAKNSAHLGTGHRWGTIQRTGFTSTRRDRGGGVGVGDGVKREDPDIDAVGRIDLRVVTEGL